MDLRALGRSAVALAVAWLIRAFALTWRVSDRGENPFRVLENPLGVGMVWHRGALIAAGLFRDSGICIPVSRSRDGERIAAVLRHLRLGESPRGSSSRAGTAALKAVVDRLREGRVVAFLADGPRGPARVAKRGVVAAARLTGLEVYPVALSARPCIRFGSWDRMILPLPFARVLRHWGEPFAIESDAGAEREEAVRAALNARLDEMTDALDSELGLALDPRAG